MNRIFTLLIAYLFCLTANAAAIKPPGSPANAPDNYPIVAMVWDRDQTKYTRHPEIFSHDKVGLGTDLVVFQPDGSQVMLYDANDTEAAIDPVMSYDAKKISFSVFRGFQNIGGVWRATEGSDIYEMDLIWKDDDPSTGVFIRGDKTRKLTDAFKLDTMLDIDRRPKYGAYNLGAFPLPGGGYIYTSTRTQEQQNKGFTHNSVQQLWVMGPGGINKEKIGHLNLGGAWHAYVLYDGRAAFATFESFGTRDPRVTGLWIINPDGTRWEPLRSALSIVDRAKINHFHTQTSDGGMVYLQYYQRNNDAAGSLWKIPFSGLQEYVIKPLRFGEEEPFYNKDMYVMTPFAPSGDTVANPRVYPKTQDEDVEFLGKLVDPWAAPKNKVLAVWTDDSPANHKGTANWPRLENGERYKVDTNKDFPHLQVVRMDAAKIYADPNDMEKLIKIEGKHVAMPRPMVSYKMVYGADEPKKLPWLPRITEQDVPDHIHSFMKPGEPAGFIGSKSLYLRDTKGFQKNSGSTVFISQGADSHQYKDGDIYSIAIITQQPARDDKHFVSFGGERYKLLGEAKVRNVTEDGQVIIDPDGNPDTSFLFKVPADTSYAFVVRDKYGNVLNYTLTWHQSRPNEMHTTCNGCHDHHKGESPGDRIDWFWTKGAAGQKGYRILDMMNTTPYIDGNGEQQIDTDNKVHAREYKADIFPMFARACIECHGENGEAGIDFTDDELVWNSGRTVGYLLPKGSIPSHYQRLAGDKTMGLRPALNPLVWVMLGLRPDKDYAPHETTCNAKNVLTKNEVRTVIDWLVEGSPCDLPEATAISSWKADAQRPLLHIDIPRAVEEAAINKIRLGIFDDIGLKTVVVTANVAVDGRPIGTNLWPIFRETSKNVYEMAIADPIKEGELTVHVVDTANNHTRSTRTFTSDGTLPPDPPDECDELKKRIAELEAENAKLREEKAKLEDDVKVLEAENTDFRNRLDDINKRSTIE